MDPKIDKVKADDICGICGAEVSPTNLNLFYCDEECRREAWRFHHPDQEEPDWDSYLKVLYYY